MQNENFYIRTLKDKVTRARAKKGIDLKKYYLPKGYEIKKRKYPLGDRLRGFDPISLVGSVVNLLGSLFNAGHSSDAYVIGAMRKLAEANGFRNLTDSDIVHLLPGGWGDPSRIENTARVFVAQLQNIIKYAPGPYPPGIFGGGYQPNHAISFVQSVTTTGGGSGGGGATQTAGFNLGGMDLSTLLLVGAGIYFIADSKPKKRKK